jgi:trehalose 6-phosphate phosphatase
MQHCLPDLDARCALFLDFDGTLVDIAPSPDAVVVEQGLTDALSALVRRLGGAVAVISGRPLAQIDRWLAPLVLPAAGVHGAERRRADGRVERLSLASLDAVAQAAQRLADAHAGLLVERKSTAVALHYRLAPELEAVCVATMTAAAARDPALHAMRGKMVIEVLPHGVSKGHAVEQFLAEPPFSGRRPVFIGDDVTDEAGFAVVRRRGGAAVRVGPGHSVATHRIDSPAAVRTWLAQAPAALGEGA